MKYNIEEIDLIRDWVRLRDDLPIRDDEFEYYRVVEDYVRINQYVDNYPLDKII